MRKVRAQNGNPITCPVDFAIVYVLTDGLAAFTAWLRECDNVHSMVTEEEVAAGIRDTAQEHDIDVRL